MGVKISDLFIGTDNDLVDSPFPYVYFLIKDEVVIYVGQTRSLNSRISAHKREKDFDSFRAIVVKGDDVNFVEETFIRAIKPKYNNLYKGGELDDKQVEFLFKTGCLELIPDEMMAPIGDDGKYGCGPVKIIAGPWLGEVGYYDDDETLYPHNEYDRGKIERLECHDIEVPFRGRNFAIVYLDSWDKGYDLMPYEWIRPLNQENDSELCIQTVERLFPSPAHPVKKAICAGKGIGEIIQDPMQALRNSV